MESAWEVVDLEFETIRRLSGLRSPLRQRPVGAVVFLKSEDAAEKESRVVPEVIDETLNVVHTRGAVDADGEVSKS